MKLFDRDDELCLTEFLKESTKDFHAIKCYKMIQLKMDKHMNQQWIGVKKKRTKKKHIHVDVPKKYIPFFYTEKLVRNEETIHTL